MSACSMARRIARSGSTSLQQSFRAVFDLAPELVAIHVD
jgi:hypothetical protein